MMKKNWFQSISKLLLITIIFSSCKNIDLFEKNINIPNISWKSDFVASGQFNIKDSSSLYNVSIVFRHTDAYQYNNIWLNISLQAAGDTAITQKINLPLGSDAQGWEGAGMNDIWEVRKLLTNTPIPLKSSTYNFSIAQIMRDNPLKHIMSVGLRIEKVN
jgi:gliding motility-associated lipoprotein GldH